MKLTMDNRLTKILEGLKKANLIEEYRLAVSPTHFNISGNYTPRPQKSRNGKCFTITHKNGEVKRFEGIYKLAVFLKAPSAIINFCAANNYPYEEWTITKGITE